MERKIKIFKSFGEQEENALIEMRKTTTIERFKNLYRMQLISKMFAEKYSSTSKKIQIRYGYI